MMAAQALIVPGTGTPDPAQDYMDNAVDYYLTASDNCVMAAPLCRSRTSLRSGRESED